MKRRYTLTGLLLLALVCFLWWACSEDNPSDESLAQIELGMKLDDVIKVLGTPVDQRNYKFDFITLGITQGPGGIAWQCLGFKMTPTNALLSCVEARTNWGFTIGTSFAAENSGPPKSVDPKRNHFWIGQKNLLWLVTNEEGIVKGRHRLDLHREDSPAKAWIKKQLNMKD